MSISIKTSPRSGECSCIYCITLKCTNDFSLCKYIYCFNNTINSGRTTSSTSSTVRTNDITYRISITRIYNTIPVRAAADIELILALAPVPPPPVTCSSSPALINELRLNNNQQTLRHTQVYFH